MGGFVGRAQEALQPAKVPQIRLTGGLRQQIARASSRVTSKAEAILELARMKGLGPSRQAAPPCEIRRPFRELRIDNRLLSQPLGTR